MYGEHLEQCLALVKPLIHVAINRHPFATSLLNIHLVLSFVLGTKVSAVSKAGPTWRKPVLRNSQRSCILQDQASEAQRSGVTCLRSHSWSVATMGYRSGMSVLQSRPDASLGRGTLYPPGFLFTHKELAFWERP